MVYRVYVEKKKGLAVEADKIFNEIKSFLQIDGLSRVRLINRYDVENIDKALFDYCVKTVFSEPQLDNISYSTGDISDCTVIAVESLPGQFDNRADSASQCIQIISRGERPAVRTAKLYLLYGSLTDNDIAAIKKYLINPVESREAALEEFDTLAAEYDIPDKVEVIEGFCTMSDRELGDLLCDYGLAMDLDDIRLCRDYFRTEKREPTVTEIRMIDTYWSDHCRHTTFSTVIDSVTFEDELLQSAYDEYLKIRSLSGTNKPVCLMDIATVAAKYLKRTGRLTGLAESDEINACTVNIKVCADGIDEDWLLLFKNETHNHPTEIEPFGGAATCIGGAIRDPLSGRAYVYAAMRISGASDPLEQAKNTLPGKLSQREIVTAAASGYSSYGNQIGVATGQVEEIHHDGYRAKHMELGAVIAAAPAENVKRLRPQDGDKVILIGGRTGRDGCGGATGSSKSHCISSLESCGAEVQKGNPPEERKLQRLFRNKEASLLVKRCNDFGAGGVSVAVGELADGVEIDLNAIPKKYEGLDGTELAISESQERMAVVVSADDTERFIELAEDENLEAAVIAEVKNNPRLIMRWNGREIVNITREFLNTNGAPKHIVIKPEKPKAFAKNIIHDFKKTHLNLAADLNVCSKRGLSERFDSTIGAGTVLMPFGGRYQLTPIQAMVHKIPHERKEIRTCSLMAYGFNPIISEKSPYHGAYLAVIESVSKLVAAGAEYKNTYLSFQEYFEKLKNDGRRWGKPLSALLGAFRAQMDYEIAAIGGKDSMSGTFEDIDVPPTLVSFAVATEDIDNIISPEFKAAGHKVVLLRPDYDVNGLPVAASQKKIFETVAKLIREGKVCSAYTPTFGGIAESIMKMCFGNKIGFAYDEGLSLDTIFGYSYGSFVLEMNTDDEAGIPLGNTCDEPVISYKNDAVTLNELLNAYESRLEPVYPCNIEQHSSPIPAFAYYSGSVSKAKARIIRPKVLIPVFPGTNCEYDSAKAFSDAGADAEIMVIKNLTPKHISESVEYFAKRLREAQIIFIPGGFSGGDEPDGSGKFITAFFRNSAIKYEVNELMNSRDGLICGICNGFQALIKLGLIPFGEIIDADENSPTLTFNTIGRHQSKLVRIRIASDISPWLSETRVGEIYTVPVSHGEGRFIADHDTIKALADNGQIAAQYVDLQGSPSADIRFNPNNSLYAIEGLTSPDGRIFGKMGHSERTGYGLYKNVEGEYDMKIFRSAVNYFK